MSLEMAQYEATLCGLQTQVSDLEVIVREKDQKVNELEQKITDLHQDRRAIEEVRSEKCSAQLNICCRSRNVFCRFEPVQHFVDSQLKQKTLILYNARGVLMLKVEVKVRSKNDFFVDVICIYVRSEHKLFIY